MNASPSTGYYVYDSVPYSGQVGWWQVGGTSAGAPQWAGLFAIANALRGPGNAIRQAPAALYSIYASDPNAFHDITTGYNGYSARVGYDPVTGLGSPNASRLVSDLVQFGTPTVLKAAGQSIPTVRTRTLFFRANLSADQSMLGERDSGVATSASAAASIRVAATDMVQAMTRPASAQLLPAQTASERSGQEETNDRSSDTRVDDDTDSDQEGTNTEEAVADVEDATTETHCTKDSTQSGAATSSHLSTATLNGRAVDAVLQETMGDHSTGASLSAISPEKAASNEAGSAVAAAIAFIRPGLFHSRRAVLVG